MTPSTFISLAIVGSIATAGALIWRRPLVMSLPLLAMFAGVPIQLGASSVRLDQLAACALVPILIASVLVGARTLRIDSTAWWLAAILAMNVISSALHSPSPAYSVAQCANLASVWVIYLLLLNFLDTRAEVESFTRVLFVAGVVGGVVAIVAYGLAVIGLNIGGAEVSSAAAERLTRAYGAYGTLLEPNLFGSFTGAHLVLAVGLLVVAAQRPSELRHLRLIRWLAVIAGLGLVLSFTRAAWLGAVVALAFFVWFAKRILAVRIRVGAIVGSLGLAVTVAVGLFLLPGDAGDLFRFKVFNLLNITSQTAVLRLLTYTMALQQTLEHAVVGWGTYTFAPLVAQGTDFQQFENWRNLWIGNYLLLAAHDTGLIGLGLWCGLIWSVVRRGIAAARRVAASDMSMATRTLSLTAAVFSMLIPFLTTSGFSLGYPWIFIGLLGAHSRVARDEASAMEEAPLPASPLHPAGVT